MAWTTPGTATAGNVLTAAFWNTQVRDNMLMLAPFMSQWTNYTPTLAQGASTNISKTVNHARYIQIGKTIFLTIRLTSSGTGTGGSPVTISLPTGLPATQSLVIGTGNIYDDNVATAYSGTVFTYTTTELMLTGDWSSSSGWGGSPNIAVANNDSFRWTAVYETTA